ncbi:MAG: gamma-glutamyl-gamma-aminobutyrate hydrolase family protein [Elusimicrobiota bacterium]
MPHPTVLAIQHVRCEGLGIIAAALRAKGLVIRRIQVFDDRPVPESAGGAVGLIVMGGPMGVGDGGRYPWLRSEMRLMEDALRRGLPVMGVCLGSQVLASVLGSKVRPGRVREIGWHKVRLSPAASRDRLFRGLPQAFEALHWHTDVFNPPPGSEVLASSDQTRVQAFRHGDRAYGLLLHLEVGLGDVRGMLRSFGREAEMAGSSRQRILDDSKLFLPGAVALGRQVFRRWASLCADMRGEKPVISPMPSG